MRYVIGAVLAILVLAVLGPVFLWMLFGGVVLAIPVGIWRYRILKRQGRL